MSDLTPCPQCQRHIRVTSATCPFCDAATVPSELSEVRATRRAAPKPGVKRAVLFALGAGLTSTACAEGDDPEVGDTTEMAQPVYGAPVDTTQTTGTTGASTQTDDADNTETDDTDTTELAQPEYGAPVLTTDMTDVDTTSDTGPIFQPVYGSPVAPDSDASVTSDAGADAGVDAAADAGDDSDTTAADLTDLAQPLYGAPIDITNDRDPTRVETDAGLVVPLYGAIPAEEK